jgi:hypothetical protein
MVDFASDLVGNILEEVSDNSICKIIIVQMRIGAISPQIQNDSPSIVFPINIVQAVASGSCDFIAQCILVRTHKPLYYLLSSVLFT